MKPIFSASGGCHVQHIVHAKKAQQCTNYSISLYTDTCKCTPTHMHACTQALLHLFVSLPRSVSTPLWWIVKNMLQKAICSHRIICKCSESAWEQRIALYISDQQQHILNLMLYLIFCRSMNSSSLSLRMRRATASRLVTGLAPRGSSTPGPRPSCLCIVSMESVWSKSLQNIIYTQLWLSDPQKVALKDR